MLINIINIFSILVGAGFGLGIGIIIAVRFVCLLMNLNEYLINKLANQLQRHLGKLKEGNSDGN